MIPTTKVADLSALKVRPPLLPKIDSSLRHNIIATGHRVLQAPERQPGRPLGDHYNPLVMDPALIKAHDNLDAVVDRAFGVKRGCATERERQEILFAPYAKMTSG